MVTFVSMHLSSNRSNVRYNNNFSDNFILLVMVCITFSLSNSHVSLKRRLLMNGTTTYILMLQWFFVMLLVSYYLTLTMKWKKVADVNYN